MDLGTVLDFDAFQTAIGGVLTAVAPVALGLVAISVGWRIAQKFTGRKA